MLFHFLFYFEKCFILLYWVKKFLFFILKQILSGVVYLEFFSYQSCGILFLFVYDCCFLFCCPQPPCRACVFIFK
ncbi:hypothetical protein DFH28DRAFT_985831 [Melampsora americana]|nr:hypothetical protein DFH28DRAFT_985831 [Melampsora americana]